MQSRSFYTGVCGCHSLGVPPNYFLFFTFPYPLFFKVGVVEFQLSDVYLITRATRFSVDQIEYVLLNI